MGKEEERNDKREFKTERQEGPVVGSRETTHLPAAAFCASCESSTR